MGKRPVRAEPIQAGGNPAVLAHPAFRKIPESQVPLDTDEGQAAYDKYARILFERGRLDLNAHAYLSVYAQAMDEVARRKAAKEPIRASLLDRAMKALGKLGLDELNKPVAAPESAEGNRFAHCGFANRRR